MYSVFTDIDKCIHEHTHDKTWHMGNYTGDRDALIQAAQLDSH